MADVTTGRCVGGPLDGTDVTVRTPDGFLAADKQAGKAWMYKRQADGRFVVCTDHDDSLIYPEGQTTGVRRLDEARAVDAALGEHLDVIAIPGGSDG